MTELSAEDQALNAKAKGLGAVMRVDVEGGKVAFFRVPNRYAQGLFYSKLKTNHVEAMEVILTNSLLTEISTVDLKSDGDFFAVMDKVPELIELVEKKSSTSTLL